MPAPKYPPVPPGVIRLTQSSLDSYLKCGIRWEMEREQKHRSATVAMVVGTAVHAGAKLDNLEKLRRGEGARLNDIIEASVAGYVREVEECDVRASRSEIDQGKDDAASAGRVYGHKASALVREVLAVEEPIVAAVSEGFEIGGTPDVVTRDGIGDVKTGKARTQEQADRSRQASMYGLLHWSLLGKWPRRLWIDNIFRSPKGWQSQRIWTHRQAADYAAMLQVLERARKGMEAGVALPAPEGSWFCSMEWCPFFRECPAVQGVAIR